MPLGSLGVVRGTLQIVFAKFDQSITFFLDVLNGMATAVVCAADAWKRC